MPEQRGVCGRDQRLFLRLHPGLQVGRSPLSRYVNPFHKQEYCMCLRSLGRCGNDSFSRASRVHIDGSLLGQAAGCML